MDKPFRSLGPLMALYVALGVTPASAQHRGGTASKPAAQSHVNAGQVHPNPAQVRQGQQQEQQLQKAMAQYQANMAAMERQAHQQHLQRFNAWRNANASSSRSSTSKTGSGSSLPESPEAFRSWYNTQKHNKALKKSYDPAYDQYHAFVQSQKNKKHSSQTSGTTQSTQSQSQAVAATPTQSQPQAAANPTTPAQHTVAASTAQPSQLGTASTAQASQLGTVSTTQAPRSLQASQQQVSTQPKSQNQTNPSSQPAIHPIIATNIGTPLGLRTFVMRGVGYGSNGLPWAVDQGVISHLRTAYGRLQSADHDYQGHRVQAMGHIRSALNHLGGSSMTNFNNLNNANNIAAGRGNLPQAQSDTILQDAVVRLNTARGQLTDRSNLAAHQGRANTSINAAIRELNTALSIR